ncbi:transcriptional regulator [Intrasporangium oryzae NRRL B-24470]|uniref:Transcriptional regulator n=1 Tax=Intrasporangium oryzae NRRL B-24470 TaxID=1386089 RepID=W9G1F6_9MICO|nr:SRPBCC family protein [Intrasporangium oryzae]EWS99925.1 transcriptional regulator [Intrasporangium oryzae NRRL B-24470]
MSSTFRIRRSIEIAAPPERVHALLDDFHEWQKWSPWEDLDPEMTRDYGGAASGVGATYRWSGNRKAGEGRMQVLESSPVHVGVDLEFAAPMRARNRLDFTLTPTGTGTSVEWAMTGPQNTVMRLMSRFWSMEKLVGPDFERGLARLKSVAESV